MFSSTSYFTNPQCSTFLQFKDGSFHVAFDKGALDALMGEDTEEAGKAGSNLLSEVQRVLHRSEGHYLCVTLGQAHVLCKHLISAVTYACQMLNA